MRCPGSLALIGTLLLVTASAPPCCEGAAITYNTSSFPTALASHVLTLSPTGGSIRGADVVHFEGVTGGSYDLPADQLSLGRFVVDKPPPGVTTTYTHMPFGIQFDIPALDHWGYEPGSNGNFGSTLGYHSGLNISGTLDGVVHDDGRAELTVTIRELNNLYPGPYLPETKFISTLPFRMQNISLGTAAKLVSPSGGFTPFGSFNDGIGSELFDGSFSLTSPADGGITTLEARVVTEPTTLALFSATIAGWAVRRRTAR